jgi:predicted transglutaminase-like protease
MPLIENKKQMLQKKIKKLKFIIDTNSPGMESSSTFISVDASYAMPTNLLFSLTSASFVTPTNLALC